MATIFTRLAASLALSGAVLAAPAFAEPAEQAPTAAIHYNDLDLATEAGAKTLDRRLHRAAMTVCPQYDPNDLGGLPAIRACRDTAFANAHAKAEIALAKVRGGNAYAANGARADKPGL